MEDQDEARQLRRWARGRFWAGLGIVLLAWLISLAIVRLSDEASWSSRWEILFVVWAPVVGYIFESLRLFVVKREELAQALWKANNTASLEELAGHDPVRIDALVRGQAAADLAHVAGMLNELRARVYRAGQVDLALRIKQLEHKFAAGAEQVQRQQFGRAPYLNRMEIKPQVLEQLLDSDERLLVISAALSEDGQAVQRSFTPDGFDPALLDRLEGGLDAYLHRFETRTWAIRARADELDEHRVVKTGM